MNDQLIKLASICTEKKLDYKLMYLEHKRKFYLSIINDYVPEEVFCSYDKLENLPLLLTRGLANVEDYVEEQSE